MLSKGVCVRVKTWSFWKRVRILPAASPASSPRRPPARWDLARSNARHAAERGRLAGLLRPGPARTGDGRGTCAPTRRGLPSSRRPRSGLKPAAGHAITAGPRSASPAPATAHSRRGAGGPLLTMAAGGSERPRGAGEARRSPAKPGATKEVGPQRLRRAGGLFRSLWLLMATEARDPGVRNF